MSTTDSLALALALALAPLGSAACGSSPGGGRGEAAGPRARPDSAGPADGAAASQAKLAPADRPAGFEQDCYTLVRDVDAWYPVSTIDDADERTMFSWIVRARVGDHCSDDQLTFDDRSCFAAARDVDAERACVEAIGFSLTPDGRDPLGDLASAMHALAATPTCDDAAAAYYSNFRWWKDPYGSLTGSGGERDLATEQGFTPNVMKNYSAADQANLIADTRAAFAKACTDEGWSAAVRSCLVAAWSGFDIQCLRGIDADLSRPRRWTAPPLDAITTFDATCDAYFASAAALATCAPDPELDLALSTPVAIAGQLARTSKPQKADQEITAACKKLQANLDAAAAEHCRARVAE